MRRILLDAPSARARIPRARTAPLRRSSETRQSIEAGSSRYQLTANAEGQRSAAARTLLFVHLEKTRICGHVVVPQLLHDRLHLMGKIVVATREHAA